RQTLSSLLTGAGFCVEQATDGIAVLRSLSGHAQPLVVLLEERLAELDASQLLRLMSLKPGARRLYAIVLLTSDLGGVVSASMSGKLGKLPIYVVAKPFHLEALASIVRLASGQLPVLMSPAPET